jgi:hypothetical protein
VDKAIVTSLFIVISMILAVMLFNVAYPAVLEGGDAIASMADRAGGRMRTDVTIIHISGELDSDGNWQDTNGSGEFETFIWVKNTGASTIRPLESLDIFFGPEMRFHRIPHQSQAGGVMPYWTAEVETNSVWSPSTTLCITIHYSSPLSSGRYFMQITTSQGVTDQSYIGM